MERKFAVIGLIMGAVATGKMEKSKEESKEESKERSKMIKERMASLGNFREKEVCVVGKEDCSAQAWCTKCRDKGRELQIEMALAICRADESAVMDPVWDDVGLIRFDPV